VRVLEAAVDPGAGVIPTKFSRFFGANRVPDNSATVRINVTDICATGGTLASGCRIRQVTRATARAAGAEVHRTVRAQAVPTEETTVRILQAHTVAAGFILATGGPVVGQAIAIAGAVGVPAQFESLRGASVIPFVRAAPRAGRTDNCGAVRVITPRSAVGDHAVPIALLRAKRRGRVDAEGVPAKAKRIATVRILRADRVAADLIATTRCAVDLQAPPLSRARVITTEFQSRVGTLAVPFRLAAEWVVLAYRGTAGFVRTTGGPIGFEATSLAGASTQLVCTTHTDAVPSRAETAAVRVDIAYPVAASLIFTTGLAVRRITVAGGAGANVSACAERRIDVGAYTHSRHRFRC